MAFFESAWSRIPPEIIHEIAAHNADDVPSLRVMSLVSKTIRSFAIEHLFSMIHFACAHDFTIWHTMLRRTPKLQTIVKRVKFSDAGRNRTERGRTVRSRKKLSGAVVPPKISVMPNVRVVEWDGEDIVVSMAVAYMALFPNIQELCLNNLDLDGFDELARLLATCGSLRALSFRGVQAEDFGLDLGLEDEWTPPPTVSRELLAFDLTALEELEVIECGDPDRESDYLVQMIEKSQPTGLKSLTFTEGFAGEEPCSLTAMDKLLRLAASSLVNLSLGLDSYGSIMGNPEVTEILSRLPAFPALNLFSISLNSNGLETQRVLDALPAPNLTVLNFQIMFGDEAYEIYSDFGDILHALPPCHSDSAESMKSVLKRKFPLIRQIGFYFCAPRNSTVHYKRGLRRRMERRLKARLEEVGAEVAEYLEVGWLDDKLNPVVYNKKNGKPSWRLSPPSVEPESEASDCEPSAGSWDLELEAMWDITTEDM
ncbi:hypothetical protein B0H19DRAFT_1372151 [Mycena capillaripes]|nr:hypothetical protein B0H19DRAFT_1372151 [Mycena capillaripes]